jgi:hypothetical protein
MNPLALLTIGIASLVFATSCAGDSPASSTAETDSSIVVDSSSETATQTSSETGSDARPACEQAAERLGKPVCVHAVPDAATWELVSVAAGVPGQLGVTKHLVPATVEAPLPPLFMVASAFRYHYEFMAAAFPDDYAGLSPDAYLALLFDPEHRQYYAGTVTACLDEAGVVYGFTVWDDQKGAASTVTYEMVLTAYGALAPAFLVGELQFVPMGPFQREAAAGWDAAFPLYSEGR